MSGQAAVMLLATRIGRLYDEGTVNTQSYPIYLDHNASTAILPEVLEAMLPWLRDHHGNPSSTHVYGTTMHDAVERARSQVAALIDCADEELYFTSGGTESNNLAIRGVCAARPEKRHLVTSVIEHPATEGPCAWLEQNGYGVDRCPVDGQGRVKPSTAASLLRDNTALVTIMHANSETGTLQPATKLAQTAHEAGALMHCDAAQSVGKVPVSVKKMGLDLLSIAGHKLYAPQGVGALYVRRGTPIRPLVIGAGHERGLRPGTENVAAIVGLGAACTIAAQTMEAEALRVAALRDLLWTRLNERVSGLALNGPEKGRLPNTLNVRFPGVSGNAILAATPGVAASTGSACHETGDSASAVITAMGVAEHEAIGSVRLTLGRFNTREEIERAAVELAGAWAGLWGRERAPVEGI